MWVMIFIGWVSTIDSRIWSNTRVNADALQGLTNFPYSSAFYVLYMDQFVKLSGTNESFEPKEAFFNFSQYYTFLCNYEEGYSVVILNLLVFLSSIDDRRKKFLRKEFYVYSSNIFKLLF